MKKIPAPSGSERETQHDARFEKRWRRKYDYEYRKEGKVPNKLDLDAGASIGHYVYLYVDPTDGSIFYVGRGQNNRALDHLRDKKECRKAQRINEIVGKGLQPIVELLQWKLDYSQAKLLESAAIDLLELKNLANEVRGQSFDGQRRDTWEAVVARVTASRIEVTEPVVLINIRGSFHPRLSPQELYDATRSAWRVKKQDGPGAPKYAFAMAGGIVREVYSITAWFKSGDTMPNKELTDKDEGRLEFVGKIAHEMSKKYKGKKVEGLSPKLQNPIRYLNCKVEDETPEDSDVDQSPQEE